MSIQKEKTFPSLDVEENVFLYITFAFWTMKTCQCWYSCCWVFAIRLSTVSYTDSVYTLKSLVFVHEWSLGQVTTLSPHYSCNAGNIGVNFTLSWSNHSAWQPTISCALQTCNITSMNNNSCSSLQSAPCFIYRTSTNISYCAPGIMCSLLEPCDNLAYNCTSNTSICVINSCCSPQAVCLPLLITNFCTQIDESFASRSKYM